MCPLHVSFDFSFLLVHPVEGHFCKADDEDHVQVTKHASSISKRQRLLDINPSTSFPVWKVTVILEVSAASHTQDDWHSISAAFSADLGSNADEHLCTFQWWKTL